MLGGGKEGVGSWGSWMLQTGVYSHRGMGDPGAEAGPQGSPMISIWEGVLGSGVTTRAEKVVRYQALMWPES